MKRLVKTAMCFLVCALTVCAFSFSVRAQTATDKSSSNAVSANSEISNPSSGEAKSNGAQDDKLPFMSEERRAEEANSPSAVGLLMRTLGALFLIVGIIFAVGWGLRRFGGARFNAHRAENSKLEILSTVALADKQTLALVRLGDETLLVGATPNSITFLSKLETEETYAPPRRTVADLLADGDSLAYSQDEIFDDDALALKSPIARALNRDEKTSFDAELSVALMKRNSRTRSQIETGEIG